MYKKIVLMILCFLAAISCSSPSSPTNENNGDIGNSGDSGQTGGSAVTPPDVTPPTLDEEAKKYGIDISQDDAEISKQIEEKLQAYYTEKSSYKIIFIGKPKSKYSQQTSLAYMVLDKANKISANNITVDISNIDFQNANIPTSMFTGNPNNSKTVLNFIFPENKIEVIGAFAFNGLHNNLKELIIPNSVITISDRAFQLNYKLEKLTLGNNVQTIGEDAFLYSTALKELTIPNSVKTIKNHAFSGSSGSELTKIIYLGTSPNNISYGSDIFSSTKLATLILPNVPNPDYNAWNNFLGCNFTEVKQHE